MTDSLISGEVFRLRGAREKLDPKQSQGCLLENERSLDGREIPTLTIFLTGAECPFSCVFCDLWKYTLDGPTPAGTIPTQISSAISDPVHATASAVKLYNASNFFDSRAVPEEEDGMIADLLTNFDRITVECHPRFVNSRCIEFADRLEGQLEVAIGLETADPDLLIRLNKSMTLADFDRAAEEVLASGIDLRAFVLVPPPFLAPEVALDSIVHSVEYASARGARQIGLIPLRDGNGYLDRSIEQQTSFLPSLSLLEDALEFALAVAGDAIVSLDLWNIDRCVSCTGCARERLARLGRVNLSGAAEPRVQCADCGGQSTS